MLDFFKGSRFIGAYGVGPDYIVSDPPTKGFWSRRVPSEDIARLRQGLGLQNLSPK